MFLQDLFAQTLANLRANKLRSFLTMFGIVWGVISILVLSAVGEGFARGNQRVLEELGKNIVIIRNGRTSLQAGGERAGRIVRLTIEDVYTLQRESKLLDAMSPELMRGGLKAKSAFNASSVAASGIWPVYQYLRTLEMDRGRPISEEDCREARRVAVLGYDAAKQLFADRDPAGSQITIGGVPYTVIGRVRKKEQDSNYTGPDDERLFLPYEAMRKDFPLPGQMNTPDHISTIIAGPRPEVVRMIRDIIEREKNIRMVFGLNSRGPVEQEVRDILSTRHDFDPQDPEAISFWNTAVESVMFAKMVEGMDRFFLAVSLVTLMLGGIGVMNIMLVAVRERTQEIGVRKALGATARSIQFQFFAEGILLTGLSGLIGYAAGAGLCGLIDLAPMPARFTGMIITWQINAVAVGMLMLIGVAASTYPARRAALLPPIEALRYEA
jgi:putative ABC transport system permease protein